MPNVFHLVDVEDKRSTTERSKDFDAQSVPTNLSHHREAAKFFQPDPLLVVAVNSALAVGAPLLITGEPGTGKTQIAHWVAYHFGIHDRLYPLYVKSTTTAEDLLYRFDHVAYFHAANDPRRKNEDIDKKTYREKGPLWKALEREERCIVLIDEIDKAPRDFPNDLLHELDQYHFVAKETGEVVRKKDGIAPPLVIITSNSERRLPEPFLRRCVFHHLEFTEGLVQRAVAARQGDFRRLDEKTRELALQRFFEVRNRVQRKKPATAELLVWLVLLDARGTETKELEARSLRELPALAALIKDRDDWAAL